MPLLANSTAALDAMDLSRIGERLLKLALPVTYIWLAGFYVFFHVWLNLLAGAAPASRQWRATCAHLP